MNPTLTTRALVIFGFITMFPLFLAQVAILIRPESQATRDLLIGKGEDWRDKTHFRSALGLAWADWLLFVPILLLGSIGVLLGYSWAYVLFGAAGAISLYINIALWFMEKEYVYPSRGPVIYFTYYWGFFVYWGAMTLVYSVLRLAGISF